MKRTIMSLMLATALTGVWGTAQAQAEPVSLFIAGITAGAAGAGATLGGVALATGFYGAGIAVGQFLAANVGTLLLAGITLASSLFQNNQMESSQVNFRQSAPVRQHAAGPDEVGGHVHFAEWDGDGNFWYVINHADSELMELQQIKLDNVVVELNDQNKVITEDFIAEESGFLGFGSRKPFFSVWVSTFGVLNPVPPKPTAFLDAFPEWTDDHKVAGSTLTFVRIDAVRDKNDYGSVYRWSGALRMGEPSVSLVGIWNRIYDPRDPEQEQDNRSTWKASSNSALIAAWHRTRPQGFNMPMEKVNWDRVAYMADICDEEITDRYGFTAPRYACGGVWKENRENIAIEADILASCDGMSLFDEEGKWFPFVGHWQAPSLTLTSRQDIFAIEESEAQDGEAETDGVIVSYKDPSLGYAMMPCAPWINPAFYQEGREPRYLNISVPTCKNHNQAVRLAKAYGQRAQPTSRIAPQVGMRGRKARRERFVSLDDVDYAGAWQIATNVATTSGGMTVSMGLVPASPTGWDLLPGEEGEKPVGQQIERTDDYVLPTGVTATIEAIPNTSGNSVRIRLTFDAPVRGDDIYDFQYRKKGETDWRPMTVIMSETTAYSDPVDYSAFYQIQYRTKRGSKGGEWLSPPVEVLTVADFEAETMSWLTALTDAPVPAAALAYNTFVKALKTAGVWTKGEAGGLLLAHSEQASRVDLFNPSRVATVTGAVSHVAYDGRQGDGTTGYINTGFNPGDGGAHLFTQNSNCQMVFIETDIANAAADIGSVTHLIRSHNASGAAQLRNSSTTTDTVAAAGAGGLIAASRTNSSDYRLRISGAWQTITRASAAPANAIWSVCGFAATPQYSPRRISFWAAFSGLTDGEVEAIETAYGTLRSSLAAI